MALLMSALDGVKADLQLNYTTMQDNYLNTLIEAAKVEIVRKGVSTFAPDDDYGDFNLLVKYTAYLYRLRAATSVTADSSNNKYFATTSNNQGIMPHQLQRLLNDRIFQEKARRGMS